MIDKNFFWDINYGALTFVEKLKKESSPSYYPLAKGLTKNGKLLDLGFTCYVLKIFYMTGEWERLNEEKKKGYIDFINSLFI